MIRFGEKWDFRKVAMISEQVTVLGICSGLGQKSAGLELGPKAMRDHGLIELLRSLGARVTDAGDIHPQLGLESAVWRLLRQVRDSAAKILSDEQLLLTLGGDHSIGIATVQASLTVHPNTRVLWVDAHGDINTPKTSPTGNLHGMPLAALLGLFEHSLNGPILLPENLMLVAVRDLDPAEKEVLKELKIDVVFANEIVRQPQLSLRRIQDWLSQSAEKPLHVSFDIDALDPFYAPATGLHVPGGISLNFAQELARTMAKINSLVAVDIVEVNPLLASTPEALSSTVNCALEIIGCLWGVEECS